jgi:hypothetical protein
MFLGGICHEWQCAKHGSQQGSKRSSKNGKHAQPLSGRVIRKATLLPGIVFPYFCNPPKNNLILRET